MIRLLIFLYDGRCWLWHYSNTSSPIWVHTAVNIHGGLNSHRKSFQSGFLAFLRKFLTSLDDHWASLESLSAVSSQPRRSTQPPARNHHGWDVIALPPLWPRSFLDGSSPLTTTTFLPIPSFSPLPLFRFTRNLFTQIFAPKFFQGTLAIHISGIGILAGCLRRPPARKLSVIWRVFGKIRI